MNQQKPHIPEGLDIMPQATPRPKKLSHYQTQQPTEQNALRLMVAAYCHVHCVQVMDYWNRVNDRSRTFLICRQQVFQLLKDRGWSTVSIGWQHGGKDHSSIVHAHKTHRETDMQSADYRASFNAGRRLYASLIEGESAKSA